MPLYPVQSDPAVQGLYNRMPKPVQSVINFFTPSGAELPFSPAPIGAVVGGSGGGLLDRLMREIAKRQGTLKGMSPATTATAPASQPVAPARPTMTLEEFLLQRNVNPK